MPFKKARSGMRRRFPLTKSQIAAVSRIANRNLNKRIEKKYFTNYAAGSRDWSGAVYSITDIPQGDTDTTRDGDSLFLKSVQLRYSVVAGDTTNLVRLVMFQYLDDTTPTVSNILNSGYLGAAGAPLTPFHHDERSKYRILYDSGPMSVDTYNPQLVRKVFVKNNKKMVNQIRYNGGTTTGSNKIYLIELSDSGAASHPSFNTISKVNFNDS